MSSIASARAPGFAERSLATTRPRAALVLALLTLALVAGGCQGGKMVGADAKLPAGEDSAAFLDRLSAQPMVTQNDAFRAMAMLADGNDPHPTFEARAHRLIELKIVDASWTLDAGRFVTRGELAYMVCQACKVPGGLTLTLTGPTQRYCLREMQYRGFICKGLMSTRISGMELVAVMARADAYKQTGEVPLVLRTSQEY